MTPILFRALVVDFWEDEIIMRCLSGEERAIETCSSKNDSIPDAMESIAWMIKTVIGWNFVLCSPSHFLDTVRTGGG